MRVTESDKPAYVLDTFFLIPDELNVVSVRTSIGGRVVVYTMRLVPSSSRFSTDEIELPSLILWYSLDISFEAFLNSDVIAEKFELKFMA